MKKIVSVLLVLLLLTGCSAAKETPTTASTQASTTAAPTTVPETTAPPEPVLAEGFYWNLDRAEYDGKSEAGMSGRLPDEDGLYRVRFVKDGEVVEMTVADKRTINSIDVNDLMGLKLDENGLVVGVVEIYDMPCERVGWQFYVQSVHGSTVVTNSSATYNGMEQILELTENTGVYDMTGKSGPVGTETTLRKGDRVLGIADETGALLLVLVYSNRR